MKENYNGQEYLIVDLRDYTFRNGNYKAIVIAFSKVDAPVARAWIRTQWPGIWMLDSNITYVKNPKGKLLEKGNPSIYFLIDETMQSAAETWAMIYKTHFPDAVFIGRTTSGTNGGTPTFDLAYGISFTMCQYAFEWVDGTQFQKVGIEPDVYVSQLPFKSNDEIFEKVIELINSK